MPREAVAVKMLWEAVAVTMPRDAAAVKMRWEAAAVRQEAVAVKMRWDAYVVAPHSSARFVVAYVRVAVSNMTAPLGPHPSGKLP
jgi:hypothetical protein